MKKSLLLTTLLLATLAGNIWAQKNKKQNANKTHKVVIQITTPDTAAYRALSKQLNNVTSVWKANEADIVVVIHNKGINAIRKSTSNVANEFKQLAERGVKFVVCEFTMQQLKLSKDEILDFATYTPYGLIEIITRQENGYIYLKGGF